MSQDHRCYTDEEGTEWPRLGAVIGILDKPQLVEWAAGQGAEAAIKAREAGADPVTAIQTARTTWREISIEAMDIGSEVHDMISQHIQAAIDKREVSFSGQYRIGVQAGYVAFLEWEKSNVSEWIATEQAIIDREAGYGCTVDAVAKMVDGRIMLVDFKTSNSIYDEYKIQVVAGMLAWNGIHPESHCVGTGILRLDKKTGVPEWKEVEDVHRWAAVFATMTTLYYQLKKRRLAGNPMVERHYPSKTKKGKSK